MTTIVITIADPAHPPVRAMVEELDAYLVPLYPAESNHLLDIETPDGRSVLMPFTKAFAPRIDIAARRIEAEPPLGLFEPDDDKR